MNFKIDIAPLADYFVVVVKDKVSNKLKESFTLNESGADMIKLFAEGKSIVEISKEIAEMYDAPVEIVSKDVNNFAERLKKKGLLL
jgi:hypothetical protein